MFKTRRQPRLAAARDVGAARDRRLDAGRADRARCRIATSTSAPGPIQLLCEDQSPPPPRSRFAALAREDRSAVVRLYLASALQRLESRGALEHRGRADDARGGRRRSEPAEADLAGRGAARRGQSGAGAAARGPAAPFRSSRQYRPPRRRRAMTIGPRSARRRNRHRPPKNAAEPARRACATGSRAASAYGAAGRNWAPDRLRAEGVGGRADRSAPPGAQQFGDTEAARRNLDGRAPPPRTAGRARGALQTRWRSARRRSSCPSSALLGRRVAARRRHPRDGRVRR